MEVNRQPFPIFTDNIIRVFPRAITIRSDIERKRPAVADIMRVCSTDNVDTQKPSASPSVLYNGFDFLDPVKNPPLHRTSRSSSRSRARERETSGRRRPMTHVPSGVSCRTLRHWPMGGPETRKRFTYAFFTLLSCTLALCRPYICSWYARNHTNTRAYCT